MSTLFTDGETVSAAAVEAALESIRSTGQSVLDELAGIQNDFLLEYQHSLLALNNKRRMVARIPTEDIPCRFLVSDLEDVDQTTTSADVRIDAQSATLKQKASPSGLSIASQRFTVSSGSIEQFNSMYRVHVTDGTSPTGTFDITLNAPEDVTLLTFNIVSVPSNPDIKVTVSADGVVYTAPDRLSVAGYQINAWFSGTRILYIRLAVSPKLPDTIGGAEYTFGLTDVSASVIQYYLASDLYFGTLSFAPMAASVRFEADADPGLEYYLSLAGQTPQLVTPGQVIPLPGVSAISLSGMQVFANDLGNGSAYSLPAGLIPSSLSVSVTANGTTSPARVAFGFHPATASPAPAALYIGVHDNRLECGPASHIPSGATFAASFLAGPASIPATLHVHFSSQDSSKTPVFTGAWLENVY